jgi:hypothetical protein
MYTSGIHGPTPYKLRKHLWQLIEFVVSLYLVETRQRWHPAREARVTASRSVVLYSGLNDVPEPHGTWNSGKTPRDNNASRGKVANGAATCGEVTPSLQVQADFCWNSDSRHPSAKNSRLGANNAARVDSILLDCVAFAVKDLSKFD